MEEPKIKTVVVPNFNLQTGGIDFNLQDVEVKEKTKTIYDVNNSRYVTVPENATPEQIRTISTKEMYEDMANRIKARSVSGILKTGGKSTWNTTSDLLVNTALRIGLDYWTIDEKRKIENDENLSLEEKKAKIREIDLRNIETAEKYTPKFDVNDYESQTAQFIGSALGSVPASYALARLGGATLPLVIYGASSYYNTYDTITEKGGDTTTATGRGVIAGVGESALESIPITRFLKGKGVARTAISEGITESLQSGKDIAVLGEYDDRTTSQKVQDVALSGLAGMLASGVSYPIFKQVRKNEVYKELVNNGTSKEKAKVLANDIVDKEFESLPEDMKKPLSEKEISDIQDAIEEALDNSDGDVDVYLAVKNKTKENALKGGLSEEEAESKATLVAIGTSKLWGLLKEADADVTVQEVMDRVVQDVEVRAENNVLDTAQDNVPLESILQDATEEEYERASIMLDNGATVNEIIDEINKGRPDDGKLYARSAYASMRNPLEGDTLTTEHYGEGEGGTQTHGHGNYVLFDKDLNKKYYYDKFYQEFYLYDGNPMRDYYNTDEAITLAFYDYMSRNSNDDFYSDKSLNKTEERVLKSIEESKQKIKELENVIGKQRADLIKKAVEDSRGTQERKYDEVAETKEEKDYVRFFWNLIFDESRLKDIESAKKIDQSKFEKKVDAQQWEVSVPDEEYLLQEQDGWWGQSDIVRKALNKLEQDLNSQVRQIAEFDSLEEAEEFLDKETKKWEEYGYGYERFRPKALESENGKYRVSYAPEYKYLNFYNEGYTSGKAIYDELVDFLGSKEKASEKLLEYGIKGIEYVGMRDRAGAVIFEDVPVTKRLLSRQRQTSDITPVASYNPSTRVVELYRKGNPQDFVHEVSHNFMMMYFDLTEKYGISARNKDIYKMLGKNSSKEFGEKEWETLTEEFMKYLKTSEAPNIATRNLFQRTKDWVIETFFTLNKSETPSKEMKEFFDDLFSNDIKDIDMSEFKLTADLMRQLISDMKQGKPVNFKGYSRKDLIALRKAYNTRITRKGKTLAQEMIADDMLINSATDVAKQLNYDSKGKRRIFSSQGTIEQIDELDQYLVSKGLLEARTDNMTAEQISAREARIENIIENAENIYSPQQQKIQSERNVREMAVAEADRILTDLLADDTLGLKSYQDVINYLDKAIEKSKTSDDIEVSKFALDSIAKGIKNMEREAEELKSKARKIAKDMEKKQALSEKDRRDLQNAITNHIRKMPLNYGNRQKLIGAIKEVSDIKSFIDNINKVNEKAKELIEQERKSLYKSAINKMIESTKPVKRTKQKYEYEYNTLFEKIRELNKLSKKNAEDMLFNKLSKISEDGFFAEEGDSEKKREVLSKFQDILSSVLAYKARGMDTSSDVMENVYNLLLALRQEATTNIIDKKLKEAEEYEKFIQDSADYLFKTKIGKFSQFYLRISNLYSDMRALFGKEVAHRIGQLETTELKREMKFTKQLNETFEELNEELAPFDINIVDYKYDLYKVLDNITLDVKNGTRFKGFTQIKLTRGDIMHIYTLMKNENSKRLLEKRFEEFDEDGNKITHNLDNVVGLLTDLDKKIADKIQKKIQDLRKEENDTYIKLYGIDLSFVENYMPRYSERTSDDYEIESLRDFIVRNNEPSFIKSRSANNSHIMFRNILDVYQIRVMESSYFTTNLEKYRNLVKFFKHSGIQSAINEKYGKKMVDAVNSLIEKSTMRGTVKSYDELGQYVNQMVNNIVISGISLNAGVYIKSLASMTNYVENMDIADFARYTLDWVLNPKKAYDFMREFDPEFLDFRKMSGMQNEAFRDFLIDMNAGRSKYTGFFNKYTNLITLTVRYGDIGAIYLGGYARARDLMKEVESGKRTLENARDVFRFETLRTQTSALPASLSSFQNKSGFVRLVTSFMNQQIQMARKIMDGYIQLKHNEIKAGEFTKVVVNYVVVQAALYQILTNLISYLRKWLVSELKGTRFDEELNLFEGVIGRILIFPFATFPFLGSYAEQLIGEKFYGGARFIGQGNFDNILYTANNLKGVASGEKDLDTELLFRGIISLGQLIKPIPNSLANLIFKLSEE